MTLLSRKGLLAVAAVVDVALQKEGHPISAKALAARHGVPPRHLEMLLQSLVRDGILKGIRGPRGGYELARESHGVTVEDILRAAATDEPDEQPQSELVVKVVLPILSAVEHECGQALSRISLDDMVSRAALNGSGNSSPGKWRAVPWQSPLVGPKAIIHAHPKNVGPRVERKGPAASPVCMICRRSRPTGVSAHR